MTGKKVGLKHKDKGRFNGCGDHIPLASSYHCGVGGNENTQHYKTHPGAEDCVWTRNEVLELQYDSITSSNGADEKSTTAADKEDDDVLFDAYIYNLFINFEVNKSELIFIMGPTGAGKSTILRAIYRDINIDSGKIFFDNKDITECSYKNTTLIRRKIGMIFQDYKLLNDR